MENIPMNYDLPVHSTSRKLGPRAHAVMDYMTAIALFGLAYRLKRRHQRASWFAALNGLSVLALSTFTDYPGGLVKRISYQTHGKMDAVQAAMMAAGPSLLGFNHSDIARMFYAQAGIEAAVVGGTNWDAHPA
jgi:hypothetical protein